MPGKKMIYEMENCLLQIFVHILRHHQARMILHHQILHKSKQTWIPEDESCLDQTQANSDPKPKQGRGMSPF